MCIPRKHSSRDRNRASLFCPFKVLAVNGPDAGREVDYISRYGDSPHSSGLCALHRPECLPDPLALRPVRSRARLGRPQDALRLSRAGESRRRTAHGAGGQSLSLEVPAAVSLDGEEGPGAYALNKQAAVTVIVAKDRKVVANLTLVQPGLTDSPKIIAEVAKLVGGHIPTRRS